MALQIAFDLNENENQRFLVAVFRTLKGEDLEEGETPLSPIPAAQLNKIGVCDFYFSVFVLVYPESSLQNILDGTEVAKLHLDFLFRHNKADRLLLQKIKSAVESKNDSVLRNAVVTAHGYMHCGASIGLFVCAGIE